jgi:dienelactone hydrolase
LVKLATARFVWAFRNPRQDPRRERELLLGSGGRGRSATAYLPARRGRVPAWILLHGITVPGRHHESLRRMARSLAAAGHFVLVPAVAAWTELRVDAAETAAAIEECLSWLETREGVDASRAGLMAFSVAATWGLVAAAGPYRGRFRSVVAVGGYASWRSLLRGMIAGEREGPAGTARYAPDPYGRWIMGANLLPSLTGDAWGDLAARREAAEALRHLAYTAGRNGALARQPIYDTLNLQLRARLSGPVLAAWDTLAPLSATPVAPTEQARRLADDLADAALAAQPWLDPAGQLEGLRTPVVFLHGQADALIPFEETLRLAGMLPAAVERHVTITRMMGHTKAKEARRPRAPAALARESAALVRCFDRIVSSLDR